MSWRVLKRGKWPDDFVRYKLRNAEACIDYMESKYGETFSAVDAAGARGMWWEESDHWREVTLRCESGPFSGELVRMKYDLGTRNSKQEQEPSFMEDFFYTVNHEEWERIATNAVNPVLVGSPDGALVSEVVMSRLTYSSDQTDRSITEGGVRVMSLYISNFSGYPPKR